VRLFDFSYFPWYIDWIYYRSSHGKRFAQACDYVHHVADQIIKRRRKVLVIIARNFSCVDTRAV